VLSLISAYNGSMYVNVTDLVPLNHPVRLAEEMASLDAMTDGRAVLTAALGYAEHEFAAFGVPRRERLGRFLESLEVIKRLWSQDDVVFEGRFYRVDGVSINPKPVQRPRPPIWMTADNTKGVARVAESGDVWFMSDHNRVAELKSLAAVYDERRAGRRQSSADGFARIGFERPILRTALVAPTRAAALDLARPYVEEFFAQYYGQMNQAAEMDVPADLALPFDALWRDRFLFTDPEGCVEEIARYRDELGVDSVIFYVPAVLEHQVRCVELLGARVLHYFR